MPMLSLSIPEKGVEKNNILHFSLLLIMKRILFTLAVIGFSMAIFAQSADYYSSVDEVMLRIPKSSTHSTTDIADYINHNFKSQQDKSRAIYIWIATNIQYDIKQKNVVYFNDNYAEIIENALKERKGVCMHFALLFNEIAQKTGIKSYVVFGYTKQYGKVDAVPHAWCAVQIDSSWFLFDPTWGAGYVQNSTYIKKLNNDYFKMTPQESIKTHIPFDPLWQLSDYPITNQEFYKESLPENKNRPYFNYRDSLALYEQSSKLEQAISSARRIEKNGVVNSLISTRLQSVNKKIEYYRYEKTMIALGAAVNFYNSGIEQLNKVIDYRNKRQVSAANSKELTDMLDLAEHDLIISDGKLKEISFSDSQNNKSIGQLQESIRQAKNKIKEQRNSLLQIK